jgi:tetratricopeptide (TPR) repeat protein
MTPDYASPEQIRGQPLTTATDIYSMGVLLYELLTGSRPYTLRDASAAEAERIICEQAVQKPSAVRGLSERTRKELAGDLDRIVLMAMDKDPSRRYASAEQLDDDLRRFLQGRPVLARRATPIYRLRKLVQRHPTASLMSCAIVVTLGGSLLFQSWQSRLANRRVEQVERLANATISDMTERLQRSPASTEAQAALAHSALAYLKQLEQSSGHDPDVLLELSRAYGRVGDIEGSPFGPNLGHVDVAVTSYQEALKAAIEARARVVSEQSARAVIEAYQRLARTEFSLGDLPTAARLYQESLVVAREFWQQQPADPTRNRLLAANAFGLGEVEFDSRETDRALTSFRAALQTLGGELTGNEDHDQLLGRVYVRIGRALNELGAQGEALEYYRHSIEVVENLAKRSPPVKQANRNLFAGYHTIIGPLAGEELLNVGDAKQAQLYARKALALAEASANRDSANVLAQSDLAFAYWGMGSAFRSSQPTIASIWYRKSLALTEQLVSGPDKQRQIAFRSDALAAVLVDRAQGSERLRLLQQANMLRREASRSEPPVPDRRLHLMRSYCRLSDAELASNDLEHARAHADLAVPFFTEFTVRSPSLIVLRELGFCFESLGNVERRRAEGRGLRSAERSTARAQSREWYQKSADVWAEWTRRGAATPESEIVRRRVEGLLGPNPDRKIRPATH